MPLGRPAAPPAGNGRHHRAGTSLPQEKAGADPEARAGAQVILSGAYLPMMSAMKAENSSTLDWSITLPGTMMRPSAGMPDLSSLR